MILVLFIVHAITIGFTVPRFAVENEKLDDVEIHKFVNKPINVSHHLVQG